jgi:hypothetical protein
MKSEVSKDAVKIFQHVVNSTSKIEGLLYAPDTGPSSLATAKYLPKRIVDRKTESTEALANLAKEGANGVRASVSPISDSTAKVERLRAADKAGLFALPTTVHR